MNHTYSSLESMLQRYNADIPRYRFSADTVEEYHCWSTMLRAQLSRCTGLDKLIRVDPQSQLLKRSVQGKLIREHWALQTEDKVWMPFLVLYNADADPAELPALIAPHGHGVGGKAAIAAAVDLVPPDDRKLFLEKIQKYNNAYALELAEQGYVVYCPDARGFGERREPACSGHQAEGFLESSCRKINQMALGLGLTLTGLWLWDLMRLVDFVTERQRNPFLGSVGFSGGGLQSLWLAALDERIQAAVVCGYFYGYRDSLLELNDNCSCNYVPGLWKLVDMGDLGALVAPRPLLIESGIQDRLNGTRGVINTQEQADITCRAYALFSAESRFRHCLYEGGHRWYGDAVSDFLNQ